MVVNFMFSAGQSFRTCWTTSVPYSA